MTPDKQDFTAWKEQNREALVERFSELYGTQTHEWFDFVEHEFAAAQLEQNKQA